MVAKIVTGKSIRGALLYNEQKVKEGKAELLLASGFAMDISNLNLTSKIDRFSHLIQLNTRTKTNTMHLSLNFDSSEKLGAGTLQQVSLRYMDLIGFGDQPFLVYKHNDSAHDHLHIVTTNIQPSGEAIGFHNIGRERSEPARILIEQEFGLLVAEAKKQRVISEIYSADLAQAQYGHIPTKRAISNVVSAVMKTYLVTSLPEYNAVLNQFNIACDRGPEGSVQFRNRGLMYSLVDHTGSKIGVPIKASAFYSKPTMANLEILFAKNAERRKPLRPVLREKVRSVLERYEKLTMATFIKDLAGQGVTARFVRNAEGRYYGVTFTDHKTKAVFKGSDLGKVCSATALIAGFHSADKLKAYLPSPEKQKGYLSPGSLTGEHNQHYLPVLPDTNYLGLLLEKAPQDYAPGLFAKRRRKRKRKGLSL